MRSQIQSFTDYLQNVKHTAKNTQLSYERDLRKMADYFEEKGITDIRSVTGDDLAAYISHMQDQGKRPSTLSRSIASIKAFYAFLIEQGVLQENIASSLKAPKVEKKLPSVMSLQDVDLLLAQPSGSSDKEIRDKAMLELLYATGIRVSELLSLRLSDLNLKKSYIFVVSSQGRDRAIPITRTARQSLDKYLKNVRSRMLNGKETDVLFVNCSGSAMSRQGFWKIIKFYAKKAGIEADITPNTLRHTFAAHLVSNGANIHAVQEMMGHADFSSTQRYAKIEGVLTEYENAHPREIQDHRADE